MYGVGCDLPGAQGILPQTELFFPNRRIALRRQPHLLTGCWLTIHVRFGWTSHGLHRRCDLHRCLVRFKCGGSVCCSSANDGDTCSNSSFSLTVNDVICQNDVCCDGTRVCTNSTMSDVESLLCPWSSCLFRLTGDLGARLVLQSHLRVQSIIIREHL